jgi:endonuclease YncB( thermonuclease family)
MRTPKPMRPPIEFCAIVAVLLALYSAPPVYAADISGKAKIVDGDTIIIARQTIQLEGISTPAFTERCGPAEIESHCGQEAAFALADMVGRTWVECDLRDAGTLQRLVGVCRVGGPKGRDLGAWMVKRGWARSAGRYAALEKAAKASGIDLWRGPRPK